MKNKLRQLGKRLSRQFKSSHHGSTTMSMPLDEGDGWEPYDPVAFETATPHVSSNRAPTPVESPEWLQQSFHPGWDSIMTYDDTFDHQPPAHMSSTSKNNGGYDFRPGTAPPFNYEDIFGPLNPPNDRHPQVMKMQVNHPQEPIFPEAPSKTPFDERWFDAPMNQNEPKDTPETPPAHRQDGTPSSCIICIEDFSRTIRPPAWISLACTHEPSVCTTCVAQSIRTDLETRLWNDIRCPECKEKLIYDDIRRLADPDTFARYDQISLRKAVEEDKNFVWCQRCNSGQLHESGESQPIVRCRTCGFRSCFKHGVEWHETLTCDEYDEMQRDPEGFQSAREREEQDMARAREMQDEQDRLLAQELEDGDRRKEEQRRVERANREAEMRRAREVRDEQDRLFALELENRERQVEEDRQRRRHEEQRRAERAKQEAEIARRQQQQRQEEEERRRLQARQRQEEEERRRRTETERRQKLDADRRAMQAQRAAEARQQANHRAAIVQQMKQRSKDEAASISMIKKTTKNCPSCSWHIEKNDGCDHMTCIKCRHEFCWLCLRNWTGHQQCSR